MVSIQVFIQNLFCKVDQPEQFGAEQYKENKQVGKQGEMRMLSGAVCLLSICALCSEIRLADGVAERLCAFTLRLVD